MFLSGLLVFFLFLLLSAFFSASETAFLASNPYTLDYLEKKGSKRAKIVKQMLARLDSLLATILIGNNIVNIAASSVATYILISLIPNKNQAILLATLVTTILIFFFGEINPKTFAAHNPLKVSFLVVYPIRLFVILFYPFVKTFTFLSSLIFPSSRMQGGISRALGEEEIKVLLATGTKGMSSLRKKMISGILDIAARPVKEIMIPRPQVKALEIGSSFKEILDIVLSAGFSRFPVFRGRLDNVEGSIHTKDIIPYLIDNKEFKINDLLRKPFFVPESAPLEKVLVQMQEEAIHLAFVVDEFGSMEGIVTLEDIIEEIVGDIQDEYDAKGEEWFSKTEENAYIIKGTASIKEINQRLPLKLPEKGEYTTLAGFFLFEYGKIPHEKDILDYKGYQFFVEKMNKRHISLIRVNVKQKEDYSRDENNRRK